MELVLVSGIIVAMVAAAVEHGRAARLQGRLYEVDTQLAHARGRADRAEDRMLEAVKDFNARIVTIAEVIRDRFKPEPGSATVTPPDTPERRFAASPAGNPAKAKELIKAGIIDRLRAEGRAITDADATAEAERIYEEGRRTYGGG